MEPGDRRARSLPGRALRRRGPSRPAQARDRPAGGSALVLGRRVRGAGRFMSETHALRDDLLCIDRDAVLQVFLAESEEGLATMEESLVALEDSPDDGELVAATFRVADTLKGNAASLGFGAITEVTHLLEGLLDRRRHHAIAVTGGFVTLLLEAVDVLRVLVRKVLAGDDGPAPGQAGVVQALERAAA